MKRKERVIREIGTRDVGESHPKSTAAPVGDIDGFTRYLGFLALPAVDGETLRTCRREIDATQPIGDVVAELVELGCERTVRLAQASGKSLAKTFAG